MVNIPIIFAIVTLLVGTFSGPALAAVMVISIETGAGGRQRLWSQMIRWQFRPAWYLAALLIPYAANIVADLLSLAVAAPTLFGMALAAIPGHLSSVGPYLMTTLTVIVGTMPEEMGWRGCALPRLQRQFGPLLGTIVLGCAWACWHLPLLLLSEEWRGTGHPVLPYLAGYLPMIMALAVFETVVFNRTHASLLATALLHAAYNTASTAASTLLFGQNGAIGPLPSAGLFYALFVATFVALAGAAILLSRGRLGCASSVAEATEALAAA